MTLEELQRYQESCARAWLWDFVLACRQKFIRAAQLLSMGGPHFDRIAELVNQWPRDPSPLLPVWKTLCKRYNQELYSAQSSLWIDHDTETRQHFYDYLKSTFLPLLLEEDEVVRDVLRAMGAIPTAEPRAAVEALRYFVLEATLPHQLMEWIPKDPYE